MVAVSGHFVLEPECVGTASRGLTVLQVNLCRFLNDSGSLPHL